MREILFRGKRKDNGEWAEGDFSRAFKSFGAMIVFQNKDDEMAYEVDPLTIGQFTGLTDKNGKE